MFSKQGSRPTPQKTLLLMAVGLTIACPGYAAVPPNSGTALEGAKLPAIQQPAGQAPRIIVEGQVPSTPDGGEKIPVKGFRLSGEPPLPTDELLVLINHEANKELTLSEFNRLAGKITQYLRQKGFLVAFAYIPAQDVKDGIVEIAVIPGKYGQIKVNGTAHINPDQIKTLLFAARPGSLITREPLERALLLINDLSGVSAKATLTPGNAPGTADLVIDTADTVKIAGAVYSDNWGNRYTGQTRYGVQVSINNVSGKGDVFNLGGLTSGQGSNNYTFGYSTPLGNDGAKFEIKHSRVGYSLGDTFADLDATGQATVTSYLISYPFIRSRVFNLAGSMGYDAKHLRDDIASYGSYSPRSSGLWNIGLSGDFADTWLNSATNFFSLTQSWGKLKINDAAALADDIGNTNGSFTKTVLTYQRQQYVASNLSFNFNFTGQLADKNLDSSEKLYLGGADGVRAFPQGEASGDEGYKLTGEFRWRLPGLSSGKNSLYLNGFYDCGSVVVNKRPYSADANRRSLRGAGLGLLWMRDQDFAIRLDYAWKIGKEQAMTDNDRNGRLWLQGVKYF